MSKLEKKLQLEIIKNCHEIESVHHLKMTRLLQTIERFGIVSTAKEIIRKGRNSDNFTKLSEIKRLDLTIEASVVKSEYGELFTDEEVNYCYEMLCELGYY